MLAEKPAPRRKNSERPTRIPVSPGSRKSRPKTTAANTARVRNCRDRYAAAPSCTAFAMSCMPGVPSPAARTWRRSANATTRDATAIAAMTPTIVRLVVPTVSMRPPRHRRSPDRAAPLGLVAVQTRPPYPDRTNVPDLGVVMMSERATSRADRTRPRRRSVGLGARARRLGARAGSGPRAVRRAPHRQPRRRRRPGPGGARPVVQPGSTAPGDVGRRELRAARDPVDLPRRLPAPCVVLRFYDDLTVPEIARQLGLSDGTVKRYLSDAIDALEGVLGPLPDSHVEDIILTRTGSRP